VDSPGCSTRPPTPGRTLHGANLDEAEPCRSEAVSPSAKPPTLCSLLLQAFAVSHQQCVELCPDISFHKSMLCVANSISTAARKNRSILKNQNYRIWDEIGFPPHRAICKSRAIIWILHQKRVHTDLFWPEHESKINVMVSFQTHVAS
jgi:hypothetical protein